MIENYFFAKSLGNLLTKDKLLPIEKRKDIVNTIVDFMLEFFGADLTYAQKLVTAQAAVIEFPGLEFTNGNPTVNSSFQSVSGSSHLLDFLFSSSHS